MNQPDPLIKIVVRSAGVISVAAIIAMLAGKEFGRGEWPISIASLILWASSEWDWWKRSKEK
ncbi:hypothetical protein A9R05_06945 [Burkholderia sp. KK1]|nr:hypothetical protein A9R05_06945 [Burkholderia sp. KK1]